jgi:quercetin dioxygenase-like cupin family protein
MNLAKKEEISKLEELLINNSKDLRIVVGDSEVFPLKHTFVDGVYIREMGMKADTFVISKIHNLKHAWFLMKGRLTVLTDEETKEYIAPCYVVAKPGAKRVIYAHEDSTFVTVHPNPNNEENLELIEPNLVSKSFDEYKKLNSKV